MPQSAPAEPTNKYLDGDPNAVVPSLPRSKSMQEMPWLNRENVRREWLRWEDDDPALTILGWDNNSIFLEGGGGSVGMDGWAGPSL
mmetsp:Transcript_5598/g.12196  ORF Transcript_5598/g.12196 Transcript_5598/m.12196 type:complete len:86 (+) Transcript_5598:1229-1486(+)